jgi:hypothetical protein
MMYLNGHVAIMVRAISGGGSAIHWVSFHWWHWFDNCWMLSLQLTFLWVHPKHCPLYSSWCSYMARCSWCFRWCSRTIQMCMGTDQLYLC